MKNRDVKREKVSTLNNEYTKEQYSEYQKQHKSLVFKRRRLAVIFVAALVLFVASGFQLMKDYHRLSEIEEQKKQVIVESTKIEEQKKKLEQEVTLLKDEDYIAKLARKRYYLSKENEQIFVLPEKENTVSEVGSSSSISGELKADTIKKNE